MIRPRITNPWLLSLQWSSETVQFVLARKKNNRPEIVAANSIPLDDGVTADEIGTRLAAELARHGARRPRALIALSRKYVEQLPMELPAGSEDEITSFVSLQVPQQLPELGEDAIVDYVALDATDDIQRVVVLAVKKATLNFVQQICRSAGARLERLGYRPLAALSPFERNAPSCQELSVVVSPNEDQTDLLVLHRRRLQLLRSVRVAYQDADEMQLRREVERSILVASAQHGGLEKLEEVDVCVFGADSTGHDLESGERVQMRLNTINPFQSIEIHCAIPSNCERFAPLVGMLLDHVESSAAVDFLRPRLVETDSGLRRKIVTATAAGAVLSAFCVWSIWQNRLEMRAELEGLTDQVDKLEKTVEKLSRKHEVVSAVQTWEHDQVLWLDELRDLSLRFPRAVDAYAQRLSMTSPPGGDGIIAMQVRVQQPATMALMESNLRDEFHRVHSKRVTENGDVDEFGWHFETTVFVRPRPAEDYRRYLALEEPGEFLETDLNEGDDDAVTARPQEDKGVTEDD